MATTLQAGDIAIIGVNTNDPDKITFVTLITCLIKKYVKISYINN